jgi:hypothetical protein
MEPSAAGGHALASQTRSTRTVSTRTAPYLLDSCSLHGLAAVSGRTVIVGDVYHRPPGGFGPARLGEDIPRSPPVGKES